MTSTITIATDSFKGSATATEACTALGRGWASQRPGDVIRFAPMADGGEGTVTAFRSSQPEAETHSLVVLGPDGQPVEAEWVSFRDTHGNPTAVIEVANTSGITLLKRPLPLDAHTRGFGQVIRAALAAGAQRLVLGLGGSSSTDGGIGALQELGFRFLDSADNDVQPGARGLAHVHQVDTSRVVELPPGGVEILADVSSPLLGPLGAVQTFGPQKGLFGKEIVEAERGMAHLAKRLQHHRSVSVEEPGAGAAGGCGFGLMVWGAQAFSGAEQIARRIGLTQAIEGSDLVVTGEGRFDTQTAAGKVPAVVTALARAAGADTALIAGAISASTTDFDLCISLSDLAGNNEASINAAPYWLEAAGAELARVWKKGGPPNRSKT